MILKLSPHSPSFECKIANSFWQRFVGLMGKKDMPKNHCLWIPKCNSIHTFFMRFPIDVIFLNKEQKVERVLCDFKPWQVTVPKFRYDSVVEFPSQNIHQWVKIGDKIHVEP